MAFDFPMEMFMQVQKQKAQNAQDMNQNMANIGQSLGGGMAAIGEGIGQRKQQENWMKQINTMMNDPNTSPQMKQALPMIGQLGAKNPAVAGEMMMSLMKASSKPPSVFRPFPGQMSAEGEPLVINEATGDVQPAGVKSKPTAGQGGSSPGASFYNQLPPDQKAYIDEQVFRGNLGLNDMGYKEKGLMGINASLWAKQHGESPFQSYIGPTHAATARAFTSGKFGQNTLSLNTAIGHAKSALDAYDGIKNTNVKWLNTPLNQLKAGTNNTNVVKLGVTLNALQGELATVFKGTGGTDQEIAQWMKYLNSSLTPKQAVAAVKQVNELLKSRLNALEQQRASGMGQTPGKGALLSPHAQELTKQLGGRDQTRTDFDKMSDEELQAIAEGR